MSEQTGYKRVIRGERVNGWENVVPRSTFKKVIGGQTFSYEFVTPPWSMNGGDLTDYSQYSLLVGFIQLNNVFRGQNFHLNRFSLLTPNAQELIMQVVLHYNWNLCRSHHLTDRWIVIVFQNQAGSLFCLCFFNVVTRWYRTVKIECPMRGPYGYPNLLMVNGSDSPKGRLDVLFVAMNWRDSSNGAMDWEFITASYEIPKSGQDEGPISAISWQSVAIPMGDRQKKIWNGATKFPPVVHMYRDDADAHNVRSMSFHDGTWNVGSLQDWLKSFRATDFGAKWLNAVESFGALSPKHWASSPIQSLRYAPGVSGFTIDGALFCMTKGNGILERSVAPHSLKRLAAEAFCKAFPNFNFADLKDVIGFDIFDGIFDGKEPIVIHL